MIKKYRADTQEEALQMASKDLGQDAIVLSIKKVTPKGVMSVFKKPYVELSATNTLEYNKKEDNSSEQDIKNDNYINKFLETLKNKSEEIELTENSLDIKLKNELEQKDEKIRMLEVQLEQANNEFKQAVLNLNKSNSSPNGQYKNSLIQFFYDLLRGQDVSESICHEILADLDDNPINQQPNIDFIVKRVYNKILNILEDAKADAINLEKSGEAKKVVFLGTTGVGKTTTIAKISSNIIMQQGLKVSFVTLDTYRIAAVEQLKTYADILNSDVEVIYDLSELDEKVKPLSMMNDFVFFDTAGRSHNNKENMQEIKEFIQAIEDADKYLVLNSASKINDMLDIINAYSEFTDFKIIFTKLDETNSLGNILNIAKMTDKKIAYLTNGQNVPSDIEEFLPAKISKALLGSMYK